MASEVVSREAGRETGAGQRARLVGQGATGEDRKRAMEHAGLEAMLPLAELTQIVELTADVCEAPIGMLSLLDAHEQTVMASVGMRVERVPRELTMCTHTMEQTGVMVVEDTMKDPRFAGHPMVIGDPEIRFYAGLPVRRPGDEELIGTLCVVDTRPRSLSLTQERALRALAVQFQTRLDLLLEHRALEAAIAERDRAGLKLKANEALFRAFLENGPLVTFMKDSAGRYVFYNAQLAERARVSRREWLGKTDAELFSAELAGKLRSQDLRALEERGVVESELTTTEGGEVRHWRSYKFACEDEDGNAMLAGMSIDLTDQRRQREELEEARKELEKVARRDELTGLWTRLVLDERLEELYLAAMAGRRTLSLMIVDMDHFAERNQRMGKEAGDAALRQAAEVLKRCVAEGDTAVRYGADEFTVLMPETSVDEARAMAERLQSELQNEDWGLLPVTVSVGISTTQHAVRSARQLFCFADEAMYRAKDRGRNRVVVYTPR